MPSPVAETITIVAFACTVGAFIGMLLTANKSRMFLVLLATSFVAVAATASLVWEQAQRSKHLKTVSTDMTTVIGKGQKTADELLSELFPEDYGTVSEALAGLLKAGTVGSIFVEMTDKAGIPHNVRVYFVKQ